MNKTPRNLIVFLLLIGAFFELNATAIIQAIPDAPSNLRSFDKYNPIGTGDKPYFGWYVNDADDHEIQSAYQIIVSASMTNLNAGNGEVWNSGKINSGRQNYIYFEGAQLLPDTDYHWKVRTWDKEGNVSPFSDTASFTTGLLGNADWAGAHWVKRDTQEEDDYTYFRKRFALPNKTVKRAIAYVAASHSYELYINGKFIGKGFNNHYPQYAYYNAWDISASLVSEAENVIASLTHWYGGGQGRAKGSRGLLVKVVIEYTDATKSIVGTNGSWKQTQAAQWSVGQPQRNGEGIGRVEKIDSRNFISDWNAVDFDDASWNFAMDIGAQPVEPWTGSLRPDLTRVSEEEIKPVSIKALEKGKYIIDLGKIYSGSFKIAFSGGNAGDVIKMYGGFVLDSVGNVSREIDQQTNMDYVFIHNGRDAVFNPNVYLGMRYLQVEHAPNELNATNVSFIFRHFELDPSRSSFHSSDPMLNNVWQLMVHSLLVGAQEGFVDTPTREKGAFLGDSWSQGVPAMSTMGDRTMNLRALNEFLDSQDQYWPDGRLNAVYPNADGARDIPDYTQSFLVWVWDYYMQTGNVEFLRSNYSRLKMVADYVDTYRNETTGLIHNLEGGKGPYEYGIIDWPANMRYGYDMAVDSRTVIDVYAYADFDIISKIAEVLGNKGDNNLYRAKADQMKDAINNLLLNKDGVYIDGLYDNNTPSTHVSQHANIFPLALNLVPQQHLEKVVAAVKKRKMNVGMVCLRWLPEALGQAGEGQHLFELYTNTEWDGWAKTIALGGTVTWESWYADETNESMSHPWGAVGLLGIQNYILGIKPMTPQNERMLIKPLWFGDKLKAAKGTYATDKGDVVVDWVYGDGRYLLKVDIPDNMTAKVYVPNCGSDGVAIQYDGVTIQGKLEGEYIYVGIIGSGIHTFERD